MWRGVYLASTTWEQLQTCDAWYPMQYCGNGKLREIWPRILQNEQVRGIATVRSKRIWTADAKNPRQRRVADVTTLVYPDGSELLGDAGEPVLGFTLRT